MYENISGLADLEAEPRFKIALVGEAKAGKSWLALSMPGTIFHMDFDTRIESVKEYIRQHPERRAEIMSKTYYDTNPAIPRAVSELEADIAMFEYQKSSGKPVPETYIIDSITFLRACCEHELIKQQPTWARNIKIGTQVIKVSQGWDTVNGNKQYLEYLISRFSELGNVIAIFHELDEKDVAKSTATVKAFTGRKTIQPQYLSTLLSIFNDIFRVSIDYTGNRQVTVQPDSNFMASTSMKLDAVEKPSLADMIAKHKANSGKK